MQNRESFAGSVGGSKLQSWKLRWLFILAVFLISLFSSQPVSADSSGELQTVYHVYKDGTYIGAVDSKDSVNDIVDRKIEENEDEYSELTLTAGEDISYIEEKAFQPDYSDEKVKEKLTKDLEVKAKAQALKVDGEVVGYFKSKEAVKNLLNAYKTNYVDEKVLKGLEQSKKSIGTDEINEKDEKKKLKPDESRVTKVSFSKDITISEETVSPDEILTKKKGLKKLEKGTLEDEVHEVEKGEVLESIANDYDLSMDDILEVNSGITEDSTLQIDQEIHVTAYHPYMDVLVEEERTDEEKTPFEKKVEETDDLYKGEKEVTQKGSDGKKEVHYAIMKKNGERINKEETDHQVVKKPVKKIVRKGTKVIPSRGTGNLNWPADGGYISSHQGTRWGKQHKGIDIAGPDSRAISAADNGVVTDAGHSGGYGNKIEIDHNNGMKTVYAHLSSIDVNVGQTVEKGHKLGVMGSTGNSTGVHLHFEVYENGNLKNPTEYVQQ